MKVGCTIRYVVHWLDWQKLMDYNGLPIDESGSAEVDSRRMKTRRQQ